MLLVGNGRLFTFDRNNRWFENGAVVCEGDRIIDVGEYACLQKSYPGAEFVDAKGGLILPGLINTHNHIYSALARGIAINNYNPRGFMDILDGMWWTLDRQLNNEDNRISARLTALDCIKNGVTTIFDHHASYGEIEGSLFVIAEEMQTAGLRACLCYEISDRDGEEKTLAAIKENIDFAAYAAGDTTHSLVAMMGLHASFTLSDSTLQRVMEDADAELGFHIHVAEGRDDLQDAEDKYGMRVVERLERCGILGPKTIAAHCIHVNQDEIGILKNTDTIVVHNPESNMGNAVGCPPTMEIMAQGIITGLGTDGYTNDMLESYKVANIIHKHHLQDCNAAWAEAPQMLFKNNREIAEKFFGLPLGVLKVDAGADIIVMDYQPITPLFEGNIYGHLLFGTNGRNVVTTVARGHLLMKERCLLHMDEPEIAAKSRKQAAALWQRINA